MKKLNLIILNWNGWKMTKTCLESLEKIKIKDFQLEVVIVDNGSKDDSVKLIDKYINSNHQSPITIHLIVNKYNLGFAEGNNVGIRYSFENKADYICLLNNDTRVDPEFLNELFKTAESDESIGAVGGKIYFEKGYEFHKDRYKQEELGKVIWYAGGKIDWENVYGTNGGVDEVDKGQFEKTMETDYVNGCLFFAKAEVLEKVGAFDKRYYLYYEDTDLSVKIKKAGYKLMFCPSAKIWHLSSGSSASGSSLHDYFITRNRLLFGMSYASLRAKTALIKESIKFLFNGREWQKKGVIDFYLKRFGRGSWK
jgi:hypothetical protein